MSEPLIHPRSRRREIPTVPAELDLVVEEPGSGFCGAVLSCAADVVQLEDRHGKVRVFPLTLTFLHEGAPVRLTRVRPNTPDPGTSRSRSGSTYVRDVQAAVALPSRIWVEGQHDAELVEKVWGHDLRVEGVVVEPLHGVDDLPALVEDFAPSSARRLGVLVDHLVPGSKEARIAAAVTRGRGRAHVHVVGHPYVDIWQAVRPKVIGISEWPVIPRGRPWKEGICAELGWPDDTGAAWARILSRVGDYTDLEPALLGRVEELIDFVTARDEDRPFGATPQSQAR